MSSRVAHMLLGAQVPGSAEGLGAGVLGSVPWVSSPFCQCPASPGCFLSPGDLRASGQQLPPPHHHGLGVTVSRGSSQGTGEYSKCPSAHPLLGLWAPGPGVLSSHSGLYPPS